jgi:hypothetical protein
MQSNSKVNVEPFIPVHYNELVEASMQCYSKGGAGSFIPVLYEG